MIPFAACRSVWGRLLTCAAVGYRRLLPASPQSSPSCDVTATPAHLGLPAAWRSLRSLDRARSLRPAGRRDDGRRNPRRDPAKLLIGKSAVSRVSGTNSRGEPFSTKPRRHCFVRLHIPDRRIIHPGVAVQRTFLPSCSMLFSAAAQCRFLVNAAAYHTVPEQSEAALPIQQRC